MGMDYRRLVRDIMRKTQENQTQVGKRLGVTQPTVSRWLKPNGQDPEADARERIVEEARKLGVINGDLSLDESYVTVVGYVGAGGQIMFGEGQGPLGEATMPPNRAKGDIVAVIVRGDSMTPQLEDGWTVYYSQRHDHPTDELLNKLCVIGLMDGRVLIKKLMRGHVDGRYNLWSVNASPMLDQEVDWAAPITWISLK